MEKQFQIEYKRFGGETGKQTFYVETEGQALAAFSRAFPGIPAKNILSISDVTPDEPLSRIMWTDKVSGEQFSARRDIVDALPKLLKRGRENAVHVDEIVAALGLEGKGIRRQIRFAKAYLISHMNLPICAERSQDGGYYLAETRDDLMSDAETYRASAAGSIRAAEELEFLADRLFPKTGANFEKEAA